jgi:hypothetical protein
MRRQGWGTRQQTTAPSSNGLNSGGTPRAMEIARGFQLEQPQVFVRWGITQDELESLFEGSCLIRSERGFYSYLTNCISLGGLSHSIGFRFGRTSRKLYEIGLNGAGVSIEESYPLLQQHLEATFGPPSSTSPGSEMAECPHHTWLLPGAQIEHYVSEHFGPAETLFIRKTDQDF